MAEYTHKFLTYQDRKELAQLYMDEIRVVEIAARLGVHPGTIYSELARGRTGELDKNLRPAYDPEKAQRDYLMKNQRRGRRRS